MNTSGGEAGRNDPEAPRARPSRVGQASGGGLVQREQEALWGEVLSLADYVETALKTAVEAVCEGRPELTATVRAEEREIDRWEVRIEQGCLRVLALYDLVASDLRRVVSALRVNRELEGLADLAENLAKRAKKLSRDPIATNYLPQLRELARESVGLVDRALASLRALDADLARQVIQADHDVDQRQTALLDELKQAIRDNPERLNTWLRLINSARNLERVADHATNIAESVVYVKEGALLRRGGPGEEDE